MKNVNCFDVYADLPNSSPCFGCHQFYQIFHITLCRNNIKIQQRLFLTWLASIMLQFFLSACLECFQIHLLSCLSITQDTICCPCAVNHLQFSITTYERNNTNSSLLFSLVVLLIRSKSSQIDCKIILVLFFHH